jgi:serpin B
MLAALMALATGGCAIGGLGGDSAPGDKLWSAAAPRASPGAGDVARRADGITAATLALMSTLPGKRNVAVSPIGVWHTLAMAKVATRGAAREQVDSALHRSLPDPRFHAAMGSLVASAARDTPGAFADDVWLQRGVPVEPGDLKLLARSYRTGVRTVDLRADPSRTRRRIDDWLAHRTQGRVRRLLPPRSVGTQTRLVLTSGAYLSATWQQPFDPRRTSAGIFHPTDGELLDVDMMHGDVTVPAVRTSDYTAISLPYRNRAAAMLLVLPGRGHSLDAVQRRLARRGLSTIDGSLRVADVRLAMPRFRIGAPLDLEGPLKALGITRVFEHGRTTFWHQAVLSVTEKGSGAGAGRPRDTTFSGSPTQHVELAVDRPFLFFVRDTHTGALLFAGRVLRP